MSLSFAFIAVLIAFVNPGAGEQPFKSESNSGGFKAPNGQANTGSVPAGFSNISPLPDNNRQFQLNPFNIPGEDSSANIASNFQKSQSHSFEGSGQASPFNGPPAINNHFNIPPPSYQNPPNIPQLKQNSFTIPQQNLNHFYIPQPKRNHFYIPQPNHIPFNMGVPNYNLPPPGHNPFQFPLKGDYLPQPLSDILARLLQNHPVPHAQYNEKAISEPISTSPSVSFNDQSSKAPLTNSDGYSYSQPNDDNQGSVSSASASSNDGPAKKRKNGMKQSKNKNDASSPNTNDNNQFSFPDEFLRDMLLELDKDFNDTSEDECSTTKCDKTSEYETTTSPTIFTDKTTEKCTTLGTKKAESTTTRYDKTSKCETATSTGISTVKTTEKCDAHETTEATSTCREDEEWWECMPQVHNTCENLARAGVMKDTICESGYFCLNGLVRASDGTCVEPEDCPEPVCRENEEKTDCCNECNTCVANCCGDCSFKSCVPGCDCLDGYKRHNNGTCIHASDCPPCGTSTSKPNENISTTA